MNRPAGRRRLGLTAEQIQDFLFYALIGVLVGGRAFFVINDMITHARRLVLPCQPDQLHRRLERRDGVPRRLVGVIVAMWLFLRKHPRPDVSTCWATRS